MKLFHMCETAHTLNHSLTFVRTLGDAYRLTNQLIISSSSAPAHSSTTSTSTSLLSTWTITTPTLLFRLKTTKLIYHLFIAFKKQF